MQTVVSPGRIKLVPSGVDSSKSPRDEQFSGLPNDHVTIAAVGNFDQLSGLKTAAWAFDVVKYVSPRLRLLLIGDGPNRPAVDRFARSLGYDDYRVQFAGHRDDVPALLSAAQFVWITHERGGQSVALEAMAAGTAVLAMRTPDVEWCVRHGETGWLVPRGDRVALAAQTAELFQNFESTRPVRIQACRDIVGRNSISGLSEAMFALYDGRT